MTRAKWYVGLQNGHRETFKSTERPTQAAWGGQYSAVIGPFRTQRGALFMARYGTDNPHVCTVQDAERLALMA